MSKWGATGYAEYDLATTPAPVLSSRRLLVAALSLPKPQRVDALVYRFIAEGEAALAARPPASPIAKVATGMPRGICTMDSSESWPWR